MAHTSCVHLMVYERNAPSDGVISPSDGVRLDCFFYRIELLANG